MRVAGGRRVEGTPARRTTTGGVLVARAVVEEEEALYGHSDVVLRAE